MVMRGKDERLEPSCIAKRSHVRSGGNVAHFYGRHFLRQRRNSMQTVLGVYQFAKLYSITMNQHFKKV